MVTNESSLSEGVSIQPDKDIATVVKGAEVEFAKATMVRPQIVGDALREISVDPKVLATMFGILETQKIIESGADVTILPEGSETALLPELLVARSKK